jgi:hypothetical protein
MLMPRPRYSLAAILLALAACASAPRAGSPPPAAPAAPHDAAVYAAVLDHLVQVGKVAVVIDSTFIPRGGGADIVQDASAEVVRNFAEANRTRRPVPRPLPSARTIRFTRLADLPFARNSGPRDLEALWRSFYEQFPGSGGYFDFSGIGFDATYSTAVVYAGHHCGSLCGTGRRVTLRRTGSRWEVAKADMLWVS